MNNGTTAKAAAKDTKRANKQNKMPLQTCAHMFASLSHSLPSLLVLLSVC